MNNAKCGYCGFSTLLDTQRDIDHYRPALAVDYDNGISFKSGYYWLTADWENMLPSCSPCNGSKKREFFNFKTESWLANLRVGKKNYFPLETTPTSAPNHALSLTTEVPLIFNPCQIDPITLFDYVKTITRKYEIIYIKPRAGLSELDNKIAETSIKILGLNRILLCTERAKIFNNLDSEITKTINTFSQSNNNKILADHAVKILSIIDKDLPSSSFIGMTWIFFSEKLLNLGIDFNNKISNRSSMLTYDDLLTTLRLFKDLHFVQNSIALSRINLPIRKL